MNRKKILLLFILLITIISGCTLNNKINNAEDIEKPVKVEAVPKTYIEFTTLDAFPKNIGNAWTYIGNEDFESNEIIFDVKENNQKGITIYIQGNIQKKFNYVTQDYTYEFSYELSKSKVLRNFMGVQSELLRYPSFEKDCWNTQYFDEYFGKFDCMITVLKSSYNSITILVEPTDYISDGVPKELKIEVTFEKDKGITEIKRTDGEIQSNLFLYNFIENKNNGNIVIDGLDYEYIKIKETDEKKWIYKNKYSLSPIFLEGEYGNFVNSLQRGKIENIQLALDVFEIFSEKIKENNHMIEVLIDFYDTEIYSQKLNLDLKYDTLYKLPYDRGTFKIKEFINLLRWRHDNNYKIFNSINEIDKDDMKRYIEKLDEFSKINSKDWTGKKTEGYKTELLSIYNKVFSE